MNFEADFEAALKGDQDAQVRMVLFSMALHMRCLTVWLSGETATSTRELADAAMDLLDHCTPVKPYVLACPQCDSKEVTTIYRPEIYEYNYFCRVCNHGFN